MKKHYPFYDVTIDVKSQKLVLKLLDENPGLKRILLDATTVQEAKENLKSWMVTLLEKRPRALRLYNGRRLVDEKLKSLRWSDYAAIRLLDYVDNAGRELVDPNRRGKILVSDPIKQLWLAATAGTGGASYRFFEDMLHLFRQLSGKDKRRLPSRQQVEEWMARHPSGLDPRIEALRQQNKARILTKIIERIDNGKSQSEKFFFEDGMTFEEKMQMARKWWRSPEFHLEFAVRSPKDWWRNMILTI